jgi:hypothetical protein
MHPVDSPTVNQIDNLNMFYSLQLLFIDLDFVYIRKKWQCFICGCTKNDTYFMLKLYFCWISYKDFEFLCFGFFHVTAVWRLMVLIVERILVCKDL